ncbi:hypothetical protein BBJ28_00025078 [Nothophytophthora sp. Chile5]|nr:hypothetical protein BBJ28_00025078 [Nothophytophthora sp. Chile5]
MKSGTIRIAFLLLVCALLGSHGAFASLKVGLFKDANFKGEQTTLTIDKFNKCQNLPTDFAKQVSSMWWQSKTVYDQYSWIWFYSERDCAGANGMVGYANETKNFPLDLAKYGFNDQMSSFCLQFSHK